MNNNEVTVANYKIMLNGSELSADLMPAITGVSFEDEINLPSMFVIKFNIIDFDKGTFKGIDLESFKPGDAVKLLMGPDTAKEMVSGEITALDVNFSDFSYVEIRGYDFLHRLRFGTKRRSFKEMKDSDIVSSIASDAGLSPQVEDTGTVLPYIFQNNQSNYSFLLERSKRIGYEISADDKTLIFRQSKENESPAVTMQFGVDLDKFIVKLKAVTEGSNIEVRGWDVKNNEIISSTAKDGSETTKMGGQDSGQSLSKQAFGDSDAVILNNVIVDASDAEKIAKAKYNNILKEFITGEGKCSGNPDIRAGKTIKIDGLGTRFSGTYYVTSSSHIINDKGYTTSFKVWRTGI